MCYFFDLSGDILIGRNCAISFGVTFINSSHQIGANVTIMPSVVIAKGCIVGTGSLVTKSTEPDGLYVGIPACRVKELKKELL